MKKNYIEPSVKVAFVSVERMICESDVKAVSINDGPAYDGYDAWGKEDNEDFGW